MALDYLHSNYILHRDVKCSNIFLTKDQDIRLGDFGLAKVLTSDDLASSVVGTPSYMCPELLADIPYGSKSDIWSLGCCMYEMTAYKPAFKAFDMQGLINKINKSIVAPLPTVYSGAFRGLIKSMLRKNPELRPSAADLLRHPHLQPYVLKVHLKSNSPGRHTFPVEWPSSNLSKKTRYLEPEAVPPFSDEERRRSFGNNRALNPSISGTEMDSRCSSEKVKYFTSCVEKKFSHLSIGSTSDDLGVKKALPVASKVSTAVKTPKLTSTKASSTPRIHTVPSKISNPGSTRELLPVSHTPANKPSRSSRRVSLPISMRAVKLEAPCIPRAHLLNSLDSLDVSVNAPRIDRMVEFPLISSQDNTFPTRRCSSTSAQCSPASPYSRDLSITKDKCTIQILGPTLSAPRIAEPTLGVQQNGSECSEHNAATGASSRSSSDSRQRRFDTSSYQQRAEALEGLLEFSAQLMQQERFEELAVLLKPFGPEKVSPRETAIWLTKSFKENAA